MVAERFWIRAIFGMGRGGCVWGVVCGDGEVKAER